MQKNEEKQERQGCRFCKDNTEINNIEITIIEIVVKTLKSRSGHLAVRAYKYKCNDGNNNENNNSSRK